MEIVETKTIFVVQYMYNKKLIMMADNTIKDCAVSLLVAVECHVRRDPLEGDVIMRCEVRNPVDTDSVILGALQ